MFIFKEKRSHNKLQILKNWQISQIQLREKNFIAKCLVHLYDAFTPLHFNWIVFECQISS